MIHALVSIGTRSHSNRCAVLFHMSRRLISIVVWCDSDGLRIANKLVRTAFVFSLCIFFRFLSFVRKKYINFGVDKLALCIHALSLNVSMPRSTPSLFVGFSYLHDKGERVGKEARHNKGVYLTLCLRRNESSKFTIIKVLNLATVDVPGVIISFLCGYMLTIIVSLRMQCISVYIYLTGRIIISAWALTLSVQL